jgi:hypothetical protein
MKRLVPVVTVRAAIHLHDPVVTVAQVDPLCHRLFAKKKRAVCRRTAARLQGPKEPPGVTPLGWWGLRHAQSVRWPRRASSECHSRILAPARERNAGAVEFEALKVELHP